MNMEHYFEAEVRITLTSVVKILETFMVLRDDEGRIVREFLWGRRIVPLDA